MSADARRSARELFDRDNEADFVIEADADCGTPRPEPVVELNCWLECGTRGEPTVREPVNDEDLLEFDDLSVVKELLDIAERSIASLASRMSALEGFLRRGAGTESISNSMRRLQLQVVQPKFTSRS